MQITVANGAVDVIVGDRIGGFRHHQSTSSRCRRCGQCTLQHRDGFLELGEPRLEIGLPGHELLHLHRLDVDLGLDLLDVRARVIALLRQGLLELVEVGFQHRVHGGEEVVAV